MKYVIKDFGFELPDLIKRDIEDMLDYINNGGQYPDCHIENLRSDINSFDIDLTEEQQQILRDYYCRGGYKDG